MQPVSGATGATVHTAARPGVTAFSTPRATRPLALVATAVVLVAFALGGWVPVARTTGPARPSTAAPKPATDPGRAQAEQAGIDVDAVVDKVRHRVTPAEDGTAALGAHDDQYRARFDATGFGFTLADHPSRFGVSLRGVQRGGDALSLVPGAWRGEANVAVRGLGSGMTERVTARAGELEWDVVLDRPLPGTGDLRLEAALRGLDGAATRLADHWRFPLGDGQTAHMGEVVVKDATGAELHRALPRVRGDIVRLEVPATVLADGRYPLTIDPTVGPELPTDDPIYARAPQEQTAPAVAWNGTNFLVVWQDRRVPPGAYNIYGTRVNGAGTVLDPGGIPITTAANTQTTPAVAWNGTNFLVVWQDSRSGECCDIYGSRVSSTGSVLDPAGIPIATGSGQQFNPAVAWNGTNYLVVWWTGGDIRGARVSGAGSVLDPAGISISTAANGQFFPEVAWNGTNFLVVWEDWRSGCCDIYGARVSGAGVVVDSAGIPISTAVNNQRLPALAWNGTDSLVVWEDSRSGCCDIYGARVSGAGSVLDPAGIPIAANADSQFPQPPPVASDGTDFVVVWSDNISGSDDIYGARVSGAGAVLDPAGIPIATAAADQHAPTVAWNGSNFLVVWDDSRLGADGEDIFGARVSGAGSVLDGAGILVSTAANTQAAPAVAWNGTEFLVVWEDHRSGSCCDIYGTRVDSTGSVLDPAGIAISTATGVQSSPAVAWNGTNYFVVWEDGNSVDIYGARVSGAGSVLDPAGIPISTAASFQLAPAVASDGTDFLVVWQDFRSGSGYDIYGARVNGAGAVLDPAGIAISTAPAASQLGPAMAWNGTDFLVVWSSNTNIYGARVSGAGSVLDPAVIPISTAADNQSEPAVASWRDDFFVVWQDRRSGTNYDIYGAGVSGDGTVAQPAGIPISTSSPQDQTVPELAVRYDYLVAWRDLRFGLGYAIFATRVSPSGVVESPTGVGVTGAGTVPGVLAVTGGPGATWGVAYERFATEAPYGANRVFLRSVSPK